MIARIIQITLGLLFTAGGLWFFFKGVDTTLLWHELCRINPVILLLCMMLNVAVIVLRAVRWNIFLPVRDGVSRRNLFDITAIGFMVNNVLPARIGEAVRVVLLWKRNRFALSVSIASIVVERLVDMAFYAGLFLLSLRVLDIQNDQNSMIQAGAITVQWGLGAVTAGIILLFAGYAFFPKGAASLSKRICTVLPKRFAGRVENLGEDVLLTMGWLRTPRQLWLVVALSLIISLCYSSMFVLLVGSFSSFGFLHGLFAQGCAAMGAMIPLAPGYVGTLHAVVFEGLRALQIAPDHARAVTILYHAIGYIVVTALGLYYFFRMKLTIGELLNSSKTIKAQKTPPIK